jgi:hypothetical protein
MPADAITGLIVSTAVAVMIVLIALVVLLLTRVIVRYAAEPRRSAGRPSARSARRRRDR